MYIGNDPSKTEGYNQLVVETANAFHERIPGSEVSIDAPIYPQFEGRSYDYAAIAAACDYMFVMAYDGEFWNNVQCIDPNNGTTCSLACSPYEADEYGIQEYIKLGVPSNKLIIGYPWYGLLYEYIAGVPFFTGQIYYTKIKDLIDEQPNGSLTYDERSKTYVFHCDGFCVPDNRAIEIWFDDIDSLVPKYDLVNKYNLMGVGMWEATHAQGADEELAMWDAFCPN